MLEPKPGDVVEVYVASEFRGIGVLVPASSKDGPFPQYVKWLTKSPHTYHYDEGDYGINSTHTLKVVYSPELAQ